MRQRLTSIVLKTCIVLFAATASAKETLEEVFSHAPLMMLRNIQGYDLVEYRFGDGYNLVYAAMLNPDNTKVLEYLVEEGLDINHVANDGRTPLHFAIDNDNLEYTLKLIRLGADLDIRDGAGYTPAEGCEVATRNFGEIASCELVLLVDGLRNH